MPEPQIDYAALAAQHGGAARSEPPPSEGYWEDRGVSGAVWHPAKPPATERVDSDVVGGLPLIGGISPETVAAGGLSAARAAAGPAANMTARVVAGAKAVAQQVTPQIKYEATKSSLEMLGVPAPMAMAAALAVSGYKRGPKAASEGPSTTGAHLDRSIAVQPGTLTQEQIGDRVRFGTGTAPQTRGVSKPTIGVSQWPSAPASVEPVSSGPVAPAPQAAPVGRTAAPPPPAEAAPIPAPRSQAAEALPDQRALNDEALARRRAEYQARQAAETTTTAPPPPQKFVPTPQEMKEYMRLIKAGKSHAEAGRSIVAQRGLGAMGTMTDAERIAAQDARYTRGEVKTPSAETARAQREQPSPSSAGNVQHAKIDGRTYDIPQRWLQGRSRSLETKGLSPKDAYQQAVQDWVDQELMAAAPKGPR